MRVEFIRLQIFLDCDIRTLVKLLILNAQALTLCDVNEFADYEFAMRYRKLCA
jgi:hypothetical protein